MEVTVFVEGSGDSPAQHAKFRKNFQALLTKAGLAGKKPKVAVCGGRSFAYKDFKNYKQGYGLLLVDSESPVTAISPWDHLKNREGDKWEKPATATDEQCHLMVQCMEAWFIADKDTLKTYYGNSFKEDKLPQHANIADASKASILDGMKNATKNCSPKGSYSKGTHSFEILGLIDPSKAREKCVWAERFFSALTTVGKNCSTLYRSGGSCV